MAASPLVVRLAHVLLHGSRRGSGVALEARLEFLDNRERDTVGVGRGP